MKQNESMIASEQSKQTTDANSYIESMLRSYRYALKEAVELQLFNDSLTLYIVPSEEEEKTLEYESIMEFALLVTNCCFHPGTGENLFSGSMDDGKAHLMLNIQALAFMGDSGVVERFLASSVYPYFIHFHVTSLAGEQEVFYADFGDDIEQVIQVLRVLMTEVCRLELTKEWNVEACLSCDKKTKTQKEEKKVIDREVKKLKRRVERIQ